MNKNVLEWLEDTAVRYPEKIAYADSDSGITFKNVLTKAQTIGSALSRLTAPRKPVAVLSGRHVYTPVIYLGIVYSGCFYAPLDAGMPKTRLTQILSNLKPELLVADAEHYELAKTLYSGQVLLLDELLSQSADTERLASIRRFATMTDPLYVIFTSGSTGVPKGVITSHQSLMCYIEAYSEVMGIEESDVLGNQSPLDYIAAIRDIYLPIRHGASMFIIPKYCFSAPAQLFDLLNERKITAIGWSVSALTIPASMGAFCHTTPRYLQKVCFSGSVMPCRILRIWQEHLPNTIFVNQYGPTEATASCTYYRVDHLVEEDEILPIGEPYRNYGILLLNEDQTETAPGQTGEICVRGPILALGYYNDPERTAQSFTQNPLQSAYHERIYHTGDLGSMRSDGLLEFHGRMDRQIKHLGHRVELGEIDVAAGNVQGVAECCALYQPDKEWIWLFYVGEASGKEIAVALRSVLPGFMVPRKLKKLEQMPRLSNGKIDMQALKNKMYM